MRLSAADNLVLGQGKSLKMSESAFRQSVKDRLRVVNKAIMRSYGINYTTLAQNLGVGSPAIHNWESPSKISLPGPYRLYLYGTQYGVSLDWLFKGDSSNMPWRLTQSIREVGDASSVRPDGD